MKNIQGKYYIEQLTDLEIAAREYYKSRWLGFEREVDTEKAFKEGAKWQAREMYSEEEVLKILKNFNRHTLQLQKCQLGNSFDVKWWFEKHKKKQHGV